MKLYEILAVEKTSQNQLSTLIMDTQQKFAKDHFFKGFIKNLKMVREDPENQAIEKAGSDSKEVVTTVYETLDYMLKYWAKNENIQCMKNMTNQVATATIRLGNTVIDHLPVDELMGLENRLTKLRELFHQMPTLDATKQWEKSSVNKYIWKTVQPEVTTKTEKVVTPVVLYEATKEHPAQVKEVSKDEIVGTFTTWGFSGAVTSLEKANMIDRLDRLIEDIKQARVSANDIEVKRINVGDIIAQYLLEPCT